MKQIYFTWFLLTLSTLAFSQTGKLTGSVMDAETKTPLELATITVFGQDSSIVSYKLSDKNGQFTFDNLPLKRKLLVSVTYTGYIGFNTTFQQDAPKTDTLAVQLALSNKDTVVVTAAIPIKMNGDTLEINPAAFKMKKDAVVEELLNQVSGITIWSDGTITVNGKKVQNLLVDGKPFMGATDPRVATQNLPKSAIEKIQLYQEFDRSKIGQPTLPKDSLLTMNLKLKEGSKKGYFGKAGAGYGTTDRFETDLSLQMYNKRSSAGIGGGINNINKNIGNLQEMFQNNTYRNYNPNLYNVGRFGTNGINKNHSFGGVLVHNFIESSNSRQNDRLTINYNKSGSNAFITDRNIQNRTALDNPQFITDEGVQNTLQNKHDIGIKYIKTNGYNDNLDINGTVNTNNENGHSNRSTEVRDSANQLQSKNLTTTVSSQRSDNESLNVIFGKANDEYPIKGYSVQLNGSRSNTVSERETVSEFESFTDASKNAYNNRHYSTNNQTLTLNGNLEYTGLKRLLLGRYNLFGINLTLGQWFNYTRSTENTVVADYDTVFKQRFFNDGLTNYNKKEVFEYTPSLSFTKNIWKFGDTYFRSLYLQFKLLDDLKNDRNTSSFDKRNLDRSFQFFRYEGSLNYQWAKRDKYRYYGSVFYSKRMAYPSIDQLYTFVDDINAYEIRIGNPNLRNSIDHSLNLNINYNTENKKSLYAVNAYVNGKYTLTEDPITDSIINDPSGKRSYYLTNADKTNNINLNYNFNISRKLNKDNIQLMYRGEFRTGKQPNFIDGITNISKTGSLLNQFTLQYSVGSILVFTAGQTFQLNKNRPTAPGLNSFQNNNSTTKLGLVVNYPAGFTLSSTADRITNSNLKKPTVLWNAFASYRFMKQQGELKFSAMDLLKQYQNISNSVNAYGTTTRVTNGLQQYFLLTFSYYPRKFGKTEFKKQ
ncbi:MULTISPECIES: carboxypeptidase regulatory-like domain-containing protein [Niastella]|uniref:Carboxypeptidase regulatory-like domain-containing protein n=1 Tax=Niastella soli TaxID=2821487 RepID=A0ABS3YY56_9BACT|nr:carboxypeptidase regulatory-like domain-containing protein [Niastella soli]MBO9202091.1 carboxypeptidase regulatory-like domain-containing protein [Niastella soli]